MVNSLFTLQVRVRMLPVAKVSANHRFVEATKQTKGNGSSHKVRLDLQSQRKNKHDTSESSQNHKIGGRQANPDQWFVLSTRRQSLVGKHGASGCFEPFLELRGFT